MNERFVPFDAKQHYCWDCNAVYGFQADGTVDVIHKEGCKSFSGTRKFKDEYPTTIEEAFVADEGDA